MIQKGIYVDGHERSDVVAARKDYIEWCNKNLEETWMSDNKFNMKIESLQERLRMGKKTYIIIHHDESSFHTNDTGNYRWSSDYIKPLLPKSAGRCRSISDFFIEFDGPLHYKGMYYAIFLG